MLAHTNHLAQVKNRQRNEQITDDFFICFFFRIVILEILKKSKVSGPSKLLKF